MPETETETGGERVCGRDGDGDSLMPYDARGGRLRLALWPGTRAMRVGGRWERWSTKEEGVRRDEGSEGRTDGRTKKGRKR